MATNSLALAAPPCFLLTDGLGRVASRAQAPAGPIALSPDYLPYVTVGAPYSQAITATGGTAPYSFAVTAGSLPSGLALSTGGTLAGTVAYDTYYDYPVTITATDANGATGSRDYTLEVGVAGTIVLSPPTMPDGTVDMPYSQVITASGGTAPYTFTCIDGAFPPGMSLDGGGEFSGTPSGTGTFDFTIRATDALGTSGTRSYSLAINAPSIDLAPSSLPDATVGFAYSELITASGGTAPYGFSVIAGSLPPGVTLGNDGTLAGTPETAGEFDFTVQAMDRFEATGTRDYVLTVAAPTIVLAPSLLPEGTVGVAYDAIFSATGGTDPYTFAVTAGELPPGLHLDSDGTLGGEPTASGSFGFTVTATDNFNQTGEQSYTLDVVAATITVSPDTLPGGTVGSAYSQPFGAAGGTGPYSFAITAGTLPAGLGLGGDGSVLDGTPETAGTFEFTVAATDAFDQTGERAYSLVIVPPTIVVDPATLPGGVVGVAYDAIFSATGGNGPYTFAITAGMLPPGLHLDSDGTLGGAPTNSGSFGFTVTATDNFNQVGERAYTLAIEGATIILAPTTLPEGAVGTTYQQPLTASGGHAPYTFAITGGALPAGLSMDGDGVIDGTPEQAGSFAFTVSATDAFEQTGERAYTLVIEGATIVLAPTALPEGTVGTTYQQPLTASGGHAPYTFAITGGALPAGLSMDGDGIIGGTPEQAGSFAFTVTATDAFEQTGEHPYVLVVHGATIVLAPGDLPAATVGSPYEQAFQASGGTAPYGFAITGGGLPPGLALGNDGRLAGTPTEPGAFDFTVTATDAFDQAAARDYSLAVSAPALPDPTDDPDVIGLVTSQVSTVRTFATTQISNVHHHLESLHDGGETGWSFWIAGSVRSGDRDGNGEVSPLSFETSGMTGGSDYRLNQQFAFGGGLGYARDRTSVGNDGSRNDGDAPSGVSYMSWHPEEMPFFLDGMGGYQDLEFDVQRAAGDGATFLGRRQGRQRFTSWQGGYEHQTETFLFSPYGRIDAASARLDGFREQGDAPLALQFGSQAVDLRTTTLGFRMHYRMATDWGEWEPRVRVEYQRDFHEDDGVSIRYVNQASSPVFFTTPTGLDEDRFVLELGSLFRTNWYGLLIRVDYLGVYGGYNDNEHALTFSFQED